MDKQNLKLTIETQKKKINELQYQNNLLQQENTELHTKIQQLLHERYSKKSEKIPAEELPVVDEPIVTPFV